MEVILIDNVEKVGRKGQKVKVRDGFFRNYLFPQKKAIPCTPGNLKQHENMLSRQSLKTVQAKDECLSLAAKLEKTALTLSVRAGANGKLYAAVTAQQIAKALEDQGIQVDRRRVEIEAVKKTGNYTVKIKLHPEVEASLQINVVKGA